MANSVVDYARAHPGSTALLGIFVFGGAVLGSHFFAETLPPVRAAFGGAVGGFGCWLLTVLRNVIDGD